MGKGRGGGDLMHSTQFRLTIARVVSTIRNCGRKLHMPRRDVYEPEAGGHGGGAWYSLTGLRVGVVGGIFFPEKSFIRKR